MGGVSKDLTVNQEWVKKRFEKCDDILKRQVETVQDNTRPEQLFGTEQNTRNPRSGKTVAQTVRIQHPQHDTDNQRTKG